MPELATSGNALHGHTFQMIKADGSPGARKDTVIVLPKQKMRAVLVADNPGVGSPLIVQSYLAMVPPKVTGRSWVGSGRPRLAVVAAVNISTVVGDALPQQLSPGRRNGDPPGLHSVTGGLWAEPGRCQRLPGRCP